MSHKSLPSVLWFPFFFAAAFALMFMTAFASPAPNGVRLGVVGTATAITTALRAETGPGIQVQDLADRQTAEQLLRRGDLAGVYLAGDRPELLVASAASGTRADFLTAVVAQEAARAATGAPATTVDLVPAAAGDVSGVGLFFYAMPLLLVGMITSIVLLQAPTWKPRRKAVAIALTGAFASAFGYTAAVAMDVIPAHLPLILYGFLLTQAIGWLTTGVALLAKHHLMPVAMTFVLILGIPTAGGTVSADMLPNMLGALHDVLPFGQFIDLIRAELYFGGHGMLHPLLVLAAWAVAAAGLFRYAAVRAAS